MPAHWRWSTGAEGWELAQTESGEALRQPPRLRALPPPEPARRDLEQELRLRLRGEVRFDDGSRALYATDGSNYRQVPIGVVIPRDADDVLQTLAACRKFGAPVLARGGGTSLAGQCCNVAVVMDFSKRMNQVLSLDPESKSAWVLPGTILDHLRNQAEKHHLTFGPDPSTHNHCTLGGMIGNNSCGVHGMMSGRTTENVHELDIVTYDGLRMRVGATSDAELERILREGGRRGEIYGRLRSLRDRYADLIRARFPKIPRRVSGYNLDELLPENGFHVARALVGSEGTCVTVLNAKVRLVDSPPYRAVLVLGYPDIFSAADHVPQISEFGPIGLEAIDDRLVDFSIKKKLHPQARDRLPEGNGWLLAEFGGSSQEEADAIAEGAMEMLRKLPGAPSMKIFESKEEEDRIWKIRESGLGATARVPGQKDTWEGWEDSAVPPERLGDYLRDLRSLLDKNGYGCALYGHFGQGCVHTRIDFDLLTADGLRKYRRFMEEATDLVVKYGGSLSGEHGDGQSRAEFLPKMFGPELVQAFREFKAIWDPEGKMNPGKVVDPYRIDENLRLGVNYRPLQRKTHFQFPEDKGSISYASLRCVGVGECRRTEGGTMCPSFMVTREEMHSTRGRAHLLHEMLTGDVLKDGWKSEPVKQALDLCLACKGCKKECPVNVDMATYKAEFLSHYYEGKRRPLAAYAMGWIDVWARLASNFPEVANFFTQTPILRQWVQGFVGIAPERKMPKFAPVTFKTWFKARGPRNEGKPGVILWADTFNNYFHPETAIAATEVLEAAGFRVIVPEVHLCCGRPLYDYGMLDQAKAYLLRILDTLRPWIRDGVPVVGLEPSCLSVFRDEMVNLLPNDWDAKRLSRQSLILSEFLSQRAPHFRMPQWAGKAIVQNHCHHKSVLKAEDEKKTLERLGLDLEILDSGCCGMAGSFGFESEANRYEVSMKVGERVLLPAVRKASKETLVVANGFSCRTQIEQGAKRQAVHLAQAIHMAMDPNAAGGKHPERAYLRGQRKRLLKETSRAAPIPLRTWLWGGIAALAGAWAASRLEPRLQAKKASPKNELQGARATRGK